MVVLVCCLQFAVCYLLTSEQVCDHNAIAIYVFGIQEIVKLQTKSIYNADEKNLKYWSSLLLRNLNVRRRNDNVRIDKANKQRFYTMKQTNSGNLVRTTTENITQTHAINTAKLTK